MAILRHGIELANAGAIDEAERRSEVSIDLGIGQRRVDAIVGIAELQAPGTVFAVESFRTRALRPQSALEQRAIQQCLVAQVQIYPDEAAVAIGDWIARGDDRA